jgi:plasmid maintenance system antidote protein VapI
LSPKKWRIEDGKTQPGVWKMPVTRKTLSAIINGKQSITPEMALKLAKAFNTSPEFWLHAQENYDLSIARKKTDIKSVRVFWRRKLVYAK